MVVSIICPVWNRADLTMKFLSSHWRLYTQRKDVEIIIIDNGSTDPTPMALGQWADVFGDRMTVIRNKDNKGFGAANNQGAAIAHGNVLIFISNDVMINGDYVTLIEKRLVGADVLLGPNLLVHNTGWNVFHKDGKEILIPYLEGWCIAANRTTWETLGGWDERYYPSDYEDSDLSYTAALKGIQLVSIGLPLRHLFGQSAQQIAGGRLAATHRNRQRFMEKWGLDE